MNLNESHNRKIIILDNLSGHFAYLFKNINVKSGLRKHAFLICITNHHVVSIVVLLHNIHTLFNVHCCIYVYMYRKPTVIWQAPPQAKLHFKEIHFQNLKIDAILKILHHNWFAVWTAQTAAAWIFHSTFDRIIITIFITMFQTLNTWVPCNLYLPSVILFSYVLIT